MEHSALPSFGVRARIWVLAARGGRSDLTRRDGGVARWRRERVRGETGDAYLGGRAVPWYIRIYNSTQIAITTYTRSFHLVCLIERCCHIFRLLANYEVSTCVKGLGGIVLGFGLHTDVEQFIEVLQTKTEKTLLC